MKKILLILALILLHSIPAFGSFNPAGEEVIVWQLENCPVFLQEFKKRHITEDGKRFKESDFLNLLSHVSNLSITRLFFNIENGSSPSGLDPCLDGFEYKIKDLRWTEDDATKFNVKTPSITGIKRSLSARPLPISLFVKLIEVTVFSLQDMDRNCFIFTKDNQKAKRGFACMQKYKTEDWYWTNGEISSNSYWRIYKKDLLEKMKLIRTELTKAITDIVASDSITESRKRNCNNLVQLFSGVVLKYEKYYLDKNNRKIWEIKQPKTTVKFAGKKPNGVKTFPSNNLHFVPWNPIVGAAGAAVAAAIVPIVRETLVNYAKLYWEPPTRMVNFNLLNWQLRSYLAHSNLYSAGAPIITPIDAGLDFGYFKKADLKQLILFLQKINSFYKEKEIKIVRSDYTNFDSYFLSKAIEGLQVIEKSLYFGMIPHPFNVASWLIDLPSIDEVMEDAPEPVKISYDAGKIICNHVKGQVDKASNNFHSTTGMPKPLALPKPSKPAKPW